MPEESCFEIYPLTRRVEVAAHDELTGEYGWRLRDGAGQVQAISPNAFPDRVAAHEAINGFGKAMEDHVYESQDGSPPTISPVKAVLDVDE